MIKKSLLAGIVLSTGLLAGLSTATQAADYPSKTITIVVPSKAGGSTDRTARFVYRTGRKELPGV